MAEEKQYYFHITQECWPEKLVLTPRSEGHYRDPNEPFTARTCVAPTVEGCIIALGRCLDWKRNHVIIYRTLSKVNAVSPRYVVDCNITGEKWLLKPVTFCYYGIIDSEFLPKGIDNLTVGSRNTLVKQSKYLKALRESKNWLVRAKF